MEKSSILRWLYVHLFHTVDILTSIRKRIADIADGTAKVVLEHLIVDIYIYKCVSLNKCLRYSTTKRELGEKVQCGLFSRHSFKSIIALGNLCHANRSCMKSGFSKRKFPVILNFALHEMSKRFISTCM